MEQGQEIGTLARKLYPDGVLASGTDERSPVDVTQGLISDASIRTLFEATLRAGPFVAKADILTRRAGAWHVLEVKSSFSDTNRFKELVDDVAYTVMVLKCSGLPVSTTSLALLSRNYRFGDGAGRLFDIVDVTNDVLTRAAEFEGAAASIAHALLDDTAPQPALVSACRSCPFFADKCLGAGFAHTVLEIPSLHHTKLKRLSANGIIDLSSVPNDLNLNERQERAKKAALSGEIVVEPGLRTALASLPWPCHYLDFETVATVLPFYNQHGCHRQVVTQFSIHHRDGIDGEVRHSEYLADATRDCERELAETLLDMLGQEGSIIVYGSFEATRIKALQNAFPDLTVPLQAILDRLRDLSRICPC